MPSDERQGIQSVEVAMQVITALEEARRPVSLSALAKHAGLEPSKVHRYLVSLVRAGLASQERTTGLYTLGSALRRLGIEALRRVDEAAIASEHALELRNATQHTVTLATWSDAGPTIIRWDYGAYPLPISVRVGSVLPLLDSSVGRVCLAYLPRQITAPVHKAQHRRGEARAHTDAELDEVAEDVRATGLSVTAGAVIPGLAVVAAPVFGPGAGLALVAGIALPTRELTATVAKRLGAKLLETTANITEELGGPASLPKD